MMLRLRMRVSLMTCYHLDNIEQLGARLVDWARHGDACAVFQSIISMAPLDFQDADGITALSAATERGNFPICEALIKAKCQLDMVDGMGGTALITSAWVGHKQIAAALVDGNASLDVQDCEGYSALIAAALRDEPEIVRCLITAKAQLDLCDQTSGTALMMSSWCGA